ncbi:LPS assembly lipoprotein LptE [Sulfurimonas sp.]|nr:LPS assembly lipoprotein LptE [Sulfurimonas sp.]MBT5934173.1 hypothetical protein [Sulfurimonas sp.]
MKLLKFTFISLLLLQLNSCGYKPSAKFARDIIGEKISTTVVISSEDPENTVLLKDAVDKAIITVFHASLTDKEHADTNLVLSIGTPAYSPIEYNNNGFIVSYRATIVLSIIRETKDVKKKYTTHGTYDFSVVPNAVLTDQERFDAIKFSSLKAITSFIAVVSTEGVHRK